MIQLNHVKLSVNKKNIKNFIRYVVVVILFALAAPPTIAVAQTATTSPNVATSSNRWSYQDGSSVSGSTRQQRIRGYRQQSSDLQQKINALGGTADTSVFMPILFGVNVKDISPNFGDPRGGGTRTHEGEDIMAVKDTPIVSPTAAVVLRTVTGVDEGNAVYTANPGGETFVYMHLDRFGEGVVSGLVLQPGSLIGYVGNTGNASGGPAHLHFEIHNNSGTPVDPFPRLTGEFSLQEKISYLGTILTQTSDSIALSRFLVTNFRNTFISALAGNITLPITIINALALVSATPGSTGTLSRDLYRGVSGEDVRALQKLLNANGYTVAVTGAGSPGNETTYFGPATLATVIKFQIARSIMPSVGFVGPITRAALAVLKF